MIRHVSNAFFMSVKSFAIAPGSLKCNSSPLSDVSMRASIQVEESDVYCDFLNNNNSIIIKLGTCIVNVLCQL